MLISQSAGWRQHHWPAASSNPFPGWVRMRKAWRWRTSHGHLTVPGSGFGSRRGHCLVLSGVVLVELLFQLPHLPQHCSSELYLAQQGGLAPCARSIITQTGILEATPKARDCAGVRWQFASWSSVQQPAGQQGTANACVHLLPCLLTALPNISKGWHWHFCLSLDV